VILNLGIVSGPSGSGKSFCIRFLQNLDVRCTEREFGGGIVWCYGEKTAVSCQQLPGNISFTEGVSEVFGNAHDEPSLLILDDMLNDIYSTQV